MIFDAIRVIAAMMVLYGHANGIFFGSSASWPKEFGVVAFFLLSGYLISQTLHRRLAHPTASFLDYAIDRWSRIYSGFLPAIFLVLAIDRYVIAHYAGHPETVARSSWELLFANLAMLQLPNWFLPFGSAAPFWTVAIEFWIYMFVGLIAFSIRDGFSPLRLILIGVAGLIPMSCITDNNLVFVPWLLGACVERLVAARWLDRAPRWLLMTTGALATATLIYTVRGGERIYSDQTYFISAVGFLPIAYFAEKSALSHIRWQSFVTWLASWSYSLYLLHHTILMSVANARGSRDQAVALSIVVSIVFAYLTEVHHKRLATYIKSQFKDRLSSASA